MSAIDLPPGIGLVGTPLGTFVAPPRARRSARRALVITVALLALTWALVARHPWHRHTSVQVVLPGAFVAFTALALAVRRARITISRDGVHWGWTSLGFTQPAANIRCAHVFRDGIALEATRGARWFIAARDWARFDGLVRQLRRAALPVSEHDGPAPLRHRLQSYGRFLDLLVSGSVLGAIVVAVWAA